MKAEPGGSVAERTASEDFFYGKVPLSESNKQTRRLSMGSLFTSGQSSKAAEKSCSEKGISSSRSSKFLKLSGKLFGIRRSADFREAHKGTKALGGKSQAVASPPPQLPDQKRHEVLDGHPEQRRRSFCSQINNLTPQHEPEASQARAQEQNVNPTEQNNSLKASPATAADRLPTYEGFHFNKDEVATPVKSPFSISPRTPNVEEREAACQAGRSEGSFPKQECKASSASLASMALEGMIQASVPIHEGASKLPEGMKLVKLSALSSQQLEVTPRPRDTEDLDYSDATNDGAEKLARQRQKAKKTPAAASSETERSLRAGETSDSESERLIRSPSVLEKLDSDDLESVRCSFAAAEPPQLPLARPPPKQYRPAQDSASEIQPEDWTRSPFEKPPLPSPHGQDSGKLRKPRSSSTNPKPFLETLPTSGQTQRERTQAAWQNPKRRFSMDSHRIPGADIMRTAPVKLVASQSAPQRFLSGNLPPPNPRAKSLHPTQGFKRDSPTPSAAVRRVPRDWAGLGETQAAMAQLEWQNRKLTHDASRLRKRAFEAEALVAMMSDMEDRCSKLSRENDRLLRRLLLLVSPTESSTLQSREAELEQQVSKLALDNKRLLDDNILLRKNVEMLKGDCLMQKYLGHPEQNRT